MSGYSIYKTKVVQEGLHEVETPDYDSVIYDPSEGSVITNEQTIKITGPVNPLYYIIDVTNSEYRYDVFKNGQSQPGYIVTLSKSLFEEEEQVTYNIMKRGGWGGNRVKLTIRPDLDNANAQVKATPPTVLKGIGETQVFNLEYEQAPATPSSYQWKKDGIILNDIEDKISGVNSNELTVNNLQADDNGLYSCEVTFAAQILNGVTISGQRVKESNDCKVTIAVIAVKDDIPEGENKYFGDSLLLSLDGMTALDGYRILGYQWYKDGNAISGATGSIYSISRLITTTNGNYKCKITLENGYIDSETYVANFTAPLIEVTSSFMDMAAFYKLDGDATDATGNYNGTAYNTTWVTEGFSGKCASFSTSQYSYIDVGSIPLTQSKYSFGGWIKPFNICVPNSYKRFLAWYYGGPQIQFWGVDGNNESSSGHLGELLLTYGGPPEYPFFGVIGVNNKWQHIMVTRNENELKFYYDGVLRFSRSDFSRTYSTSQYVRINGCIEYQKESINSYQEEIGFWNRALTEDEVAELYQQGIDGKTYPFTSWIPDPNWHD